jgi:CO dehydrogenase/acetyl-CoA synthase delta subunit
MEYKAPLETYNGKVAEVTIGEGSKAVKIGGQNILPFHYFEGEQTNKPLVALEIWDTEPEGWAEGLLEPYKGVIGDPAAWAKKSIEYGADLICIRLASTDPTGKNRTADEAAATVKKVAEAVPVPLVIYGCGDEAKDVAALTRVAEVCSGQKLLIGPLVKENYDPISKAALEHGHNIIAQTPLDINLEKELNVKLLKSFPPDRIVIDPLSSGLGYGMEYSFTIMERTRQTAVMFGDTTMQMPLIADLGGECWKTKQAKANKEQGLLWEGVTAMSLLLAGADILIVRHPDNCRYIREAIDGSM